MTSLIRHAVRGPLTRTSALVEQSGAVERAASGVNELLPRFRQNLLILDYLRPPAGSIKPIGIKNCDQVYIHELEPTVHEPH